MSHPTRVRRLKFYGINKSKRGICVAPYTGAWIEIPCYIIKAIFKMVAPYTGAWIEISVNYLCWYCPVVAPYTGAWIEIKGHLQTDVLRLSHPTRVRGLKFESVVGRVGNDGRTLHGCVD